MGWKHGYAVVMLVAAASVLRCGRAEAQCERYPPAAEAPREVETPRGNHLSYFYNLTIERYFVVVTRGGGDGIPRGPFVLTRGCRPARLDWESEQFVVLTADCGTFCWEALALPVGPRGEPFHAMRPFAFDAERNLLAYYAEPDVITVKNLATGHEQAVRTPTRCPTASGTCFDDKLELADGRLRYVWKYWLPLPDGTFKHFPDEPIDVELDADVTGRP